MSFVKSNQRWNYKTFDLRPMQGPDFLDKLGQLLDEAGKKGWELAHLNEKFMILKQLYLEED